MILELLSLIREAIQEANTEPTPIASVNWDKQQIFAPISSTIEDFNNRAKLKIEPRDHRDYVPAQQVAITLTDCAVVACISDGKWNLDRYVHIWAGEYDLERDSRNYKVRFTTGQRSGPQLFVAEFPYGDIPGKMGDYLSFHNLDPAVFAFGDNANAAIKKFVSLLVKNRATIAEK